jgi:hypothetical protein
LPYHPIRHRIRNDRSFHKHRHSVSFLFSFLCGAAAQSVPQLALGLLLLRWIDSGVDIFPGFHGLLQTGHIGFVEVTMADAFPDQWKICCLKDGDLSLTYVFIG